MENKNSVRDDMNLIAERAAIVLRLRMREVSPIWRLCRVFGELPAPIATRFGVGGRRDGRKGEGGDDGGGKN